MKTILFFILFFTSTIPSYCIGRSDKKLANKVDVINYLPLQSDKNPVTFWNAVRQNNRDYIKIKTKLDYNKHGLSKKVRGIIESAANESDNYYNSRVINLPWLDSLKYILIGDHNLLYPPVSPINLFILPHEEVNANATPLGKIYIYSGLLEKIENQSNVANILLAIIAHEIVHVMLEHSVIHTYMSLKNERSNNLWAGFAVGLNSANATFNAANNGTRVDYNALYNYNLLMFNIAKEDSILYQYKYSKQQEIEADIIAFRLLDYIGIGGEYLISALLTSKDSFDYADAYSDHPTIENRVEILKYLSENKRIISE